MQINSSNLALFSQNSAYSRLEKKEQLSIRTSSPNSTGTQTSELSFRHSTMIEQSSLMSSQQIAKFSQNSSLKDTAFKIADSVNQARDRARSSEAAGSVADVDSDWTIKLSPEDKKRLMLLMALFAKFIDKNSLDFGKELLKQSDKAPENTNNTQPPSQAQAAANVLPTVQYSESTTFIESQSSAFSATGQIQTTDGQTINISLNLQMSQTTVQVSETSLTLAGERKDPLVINLNNNSVQFNGNTFSFDLQSNGSPIAMPSLTSNSGYLVLDKNKDGTVNNGSELFGTKSGNGINDLAQYDINPNGWIDENDAVFNDLKLWINSGTDSQQLVTLKSLGIGAIYVGGSAKTPLNIQNPNKTDQNLGAITATGIYLKDNDEVGTIQDIDINV